LKEKETEEKNLDDEMNGAAGKVSDDGAAQDDSMGADVPWRRLQSGKPSFATLKRETLQQNIS